MNDVPRTVIGVSRLGVGGISLLAPDTAAQVFGMDPARSNSFATRLFGAREVALALGLLLAPDVHVRTVALLGATIDSIDVVSSCVEIRRGRMSRRAIISGTGGAAVFAALGLLAARRA